MAANKPEAPKPGGDAGKGDAATAAPAAPAASGGGISAWLPLIIAIILMPALAYVTTTFVLLPKITAAMGHKAAGEEKGAAKSEGKSEAKKETKKEEAKAPAHGGGGSASKSEGKGTSFPLSKVLVNVKDTKGTRYLMVQMTLVGSGKNFTACIEDNLDKITDLAISTLSGKTIADLEQPGIQNISRNELLTAFNAALGENQVQEIFFKEWVIQ